MSPATFLRRGLVLAAVVLAALPAVAQYGAASYADTKGMNERFRLDVGGFFQDFETTVRYDGSLGNTGTEVNLESDLGVPDSKTTFRADGYWRFGPRGRLDFGYRSWNRSSTKTLDRDIQFGDQVFHVGASVDAALRIRVAELYYSYSWVNTGVVEFGTGIGVSSYWNKVRVEASASAGGASTEAQYEEADLIAPIPAIQGYLTLTLLPRLFVGAKAKWVSATISDYHGSMTDIRASLDYYLSKNIGIGGGYNLVKIVYEETKERGTTRFDYDYSGPMAYLSIAF